ncbi:hypothetical protein [Methylohalobius crimeensis]|uniref:hypothetical protein n=1 Tax=Methylohalobius crimeensis TaxID=244365 RepID=UPI001F270F8B|nr:hypothetical protein [Methylohalobius crimeensis]
MLFAFLFAGFNKLAYGLVQSGFVQLKVQSRGDAFSLDVQYAPLGQSFPGRLLFVTGQAGFLGPIMHALVEPPSLYPPVPIDHLGEKNRARDGSGNVDEDAVIGNRPIQGIDVVDAIH